MLTTYLDIHLKYTLPVIGALTLITRPFINHWEIFKIVLISSFAFVYTIPWDNYIISNEAWTYPSEKVLAVIGHIPIEEYMFFVIQTILTCLWTLLCVRWSTPCLHFNYNKQSYQLIRWIPIIILCGVMVIGYRISIPGQNTFYLGCILYWVSPVIIFMWYGAGNFFIKNIIPSSISIMIPTLYLCWTDQVALKNNIWHVNEKTSLNIFVAKDLPLEEAFFFFVTNLIIVLAVNSCDKSRGMMETYALEFPHRFGINQKFIRQMFCAFTIPEYSMSSIVTKDIKIGMEVLSIASKSFNAASYLFHSGPRLDLTIVYAFSRVTDDMIDDESDVEKKKHKLKIIQKFVNELFADRKSDYETKTKPYDTKINWAQYEIDLTDIEMSCFRAISRIAFYLPRKPFHELIAGYQWDIEGRLVKDENDLLLYSSYVAGSIGALCVYVIMYRCDGTDMDDIDGKYSYVIEKAQQMGRVLQLVNIARDIVTDSETLGRCYVPTEYMDDEDEEVRILCSEKNPRLLGNKKLKKYSTKMILLADVNQKESVNAIRCLPLEARGSILAATEIYQGLTSSLLSSKTYPTRASISKWKKILIGIYSLYIKSIQFVV